MASVTFDNVTKSYGEGALAVRGLNLEVRDTEFMVLVGPSGCGKSTALRMLAGLESVTDGEIRIGDRVMNQVPARERDIAMVFQSYALYPHKSVRDNLGFGLKVRKVPKDERQRLVGEVSASLGLDNLLDRRPSELSGGQRQRVALGRAIVRDPQAFLLDEPLSNLDAQLRLQTRLEIVRMHERLQSTFVYVTHDQVEAMTMGDRIAVMRDGVLQQVATPEGIYHKPVNRYVATFIGSPPMNLIPVRTSGDTVTRDDVWSMTFPGPVGQGDADLGIRPEALSLYVDGQAFRIELLVDVVEVLGSDKYAYGQFDGVPIAVRLDARAHIRAGERIVLGADAADVHIFDGQSGVRRDVAL